MPVARTLSRVIKVTPTLDTNAYASGDRLGSVMTLNNAVNDVGGTGVLYSISVIDSDKQSQAIDFLFFDGSSTSPAAAPTIASSDNAAIDVTDAIMAASFLGRVSVATSDYTSLANNSEATKTGIGLLLCTAAKQRVIYCVMVCRSGTPTYTASGLAINFGILQD